MSIELLRQRVTEGASVATPVLESALAEIDALKAGLTEAEAADRADTANLGILLRKLDVETVDDAVRAIAERDALQARLAEAERRAAGRHDAAYDRVEVLLRREAELIEAVDVCEKGYHDLMSRALAAEARAEQYRLALEAVEWVLPGPALVYKGCPWCKSEVPPRHKPDCQRQLALAPQEKAERLLEAERQHSAALQEECNKAVDAMEWANSKKSKASQMVARFKRALEIYAKEENWSKTHKADSHAEVFNIYLNGRVINGWEIAQEALLAPQERGAEGENARLRKALGLVLEHIDEYEGIPMCYCNGSEKCDRCIIVSALDAPGEAGKADRLTVFEYHGKIYNRPLGRGICLDDNDPNNLELEERIPEGNFQADIVIRASCATPEGERTSNE